LLLSYYPITQDSYAEAISTINKIIFGISTSNTF